jgi:uncharacterized protein (TIGR03083 family)
MTPAGIIDTRPLFRPLHRELIALLRNLSPEDWNQPTICKDWAVRDIAAHLLDGDLRRLSITRDHHALAPPPIESYTDLVTWLNQLNADWVAAMRRLSPRMLCDLLELSGTQSSDYFESTDLEADAPFPVAWAGEQKSLMWFDVAREYTERWHHQQQIRDAVQAEPLTLREWLTPVLDTFLRALPYSYRNAEAEVGTAVVIAITGHAGGMWTLLREQSWSLYYGETEHATTRIALSSDIAWRLFTKGLPGEQAKAQSAILGNAALAEPFFQTIAIMG